VVASFKEETGKLKNNSFLFFSLAWLFNSKKNTYSIPAKRNKKGRNYYFLTS
jgi:hypothetical protein